MKPEAWAEAEREAVRRGLLEKGGYMTIQEEIKERGRQEGMLAGMRKGGRLKGREKAQGKAFFVDFAPKSCILRIEALKF